RAALEEIQADGETLQFVRCAIDDSGRDSEVHQNIRDDHLYARGPTAMRDEARSMFADVRENCGFVDRRLLGRLEIRHRMGGHARFGSPGLHDGYPVCIAV
ncbi:MAG TPA: hypothetical protein VNF49_10330, partial [Candidatus Binataceae bacterium]|nr:hypothetical protein [Candidatus Binataceae bacterium]